MSSEPLRGRDTGVPLDPFDPFDPAFQADPYPTYARYRAADPCHRGVPPMPSMPRCRYLFRYAEVSAVLHDDRFGRRRVGRGPGGEASARSGSTPIRRVARRMALFADPPRHERLRRGLEAAWSEEVTRRVTARAGELARTLLDELLAREEADLMHDLCVPLPVLVMAEALGVPAEDRLRLKRWSTDIVTLTDLHRDGRAMARAARATAEVADYLRALLAERRRRPGPDLLSGMAARSGEEGGLDEEEIVANGVLLLAAGHETTVGLLGNGLRALLARPGVVRRLTRTPSLVRRAVEEALRFDSPIQMTFRVAREPARLGALEVGRGEAVALVLGAANRDPAVFREPDRFFPERAPNAHLAFGAGRHTCYGAALARREAEAVFGAIAPHLARIHPAGPPELADNFLFRSLRSLPVRIEGAG